jgi:cytochrome P450
VAFSPYDYRIHEDPYPVYARLRDEAPLYRNSDLDFWALSRHEDVVAAFRDPSRFSSANGVSLDPAAWGPYAHKTMSFLPLDPPRHTRMRALVSKGFTARRVRELEHQIRALARRHLGAAVARGEFDFVADFAGLLPMDVISEMIGVPEADRDDVRKLADTVVHREDGLFDVPQAGMEAALTLVGYYPPLILLLRAATRELEVLGHRIPAGALVGATPAISNRIAADFPEPDAFRPERYAEPRQEDLINRWTWIPFGAGRHRCVGANFAMIQLKAIFSVLLRDWSFELAQPPGSYRNDHSKMVVRSRGRAWSATAAGATRVEVDLDAHHAAASCARVTRCASSRRPTCSRCRARARSPWPSRRRPNRSGPRWRRPCGTAPHRRSACWTTDHGASRYGP